MRAAVVGALVVTAVEAPAVYAFLRLEDDHFWLGVACLGVGEMLETTIAGLDVQRRLRQRNDPGEPEHEPGSLVRHRRRLRNLLLAMSFAEILLWIAWVKVAEE